MIAKGPVAQGSAGLLDGVHCNKSAPVILSVVGSLDAASIIASSTFTVHVCYFHPQLTRRTLYRDKDYLDAKFSLTNIIFLDHF